MIRLTIRAAYEPLLDLVCMDTLHADRSIKTFTNDLRDWVTGRGGVIEVVLSETFWIAVRRTIIPGATSVPHRVTAAEVEIDEVTAVELALVFADQYEVEADFG